MVGDTLVKGGAVWDGLQDKLLSRHSLLIEGERIKAVAPTAELQSASFRQTVNWSAFTLIPGLIDSHTHLSMDASMPNYLSRMTDGIAELTLRAVAMMKRDLAAGITSCRCLGDKEFLDVACRQAVQDGLVEGPRLWVATRGIRSPHGHGFVGYPFSGPEEIRQAIHENLQAGADFIKIYISGTLRESGGLRSFLTREEIFTALDTAHQSGVRVAAHCVGGSGLDWALEMGLDTLEHAYHISDQQIDHLVESDTLLVLTPGPVLSEKRIHFLPAGLIPGHMQEKDIMFERMAKCIEQGLSFAVGTDGLHGELKHEISYLIQMGASTYQALQAATIMGAKACGQENDCGSLEAGKFADIVALRGNPLESVKTLQRVCGIMKSGQLVPCKESNEN